MLHQYNVDVAAWNHRPRLIEWCFLSSAILYGASFVGSMFSSSWTVPVGVTAVVVQVIETRAWEYSPCAPLSMHTCIICLHLCTVQHYAVLRHCIAPHCTPLQHTTPNDCTALHCTALHYTALDCTALHCISTLHSTAWCWCWCWYPLMAT